MSGTSGSGAGPAEAGGPDLGTAPDGAGSPQDAGSLRRLVWLTRGHGRRLRRAIALSLVASAAMLVQPLIVKAVLDDTAASGVTWGLLPLLAGLFAVQAAVRAVSQFVLQRTGEDVVLGVRLGLVRRLLGLRMDVYAQHRTGDLLSRVGTDSTALRTLVTHGITELISGVLMLVAAAGIMLWLDWQLFLVVAGTVVVAGFALRAVFAALRTASLRTQEALGALSADLERALGAIRTVRASSAQERERSRIGDRARQAHSAGVRMAWHRSLAAPAMELAVNGSFLVVLLYGGVRVATGTSSLADMIAFLLYMTYLTTPLTSVFESLATLQEGNGAMRRIQATLDLPREEAPGQAPAPEAEPAPEEAPGPAGPLQPRARPHVPREDPAGAAFGPVLGLDPVLALDGVSFGYGHGPVLREVTLRVAATGCTALVGPSGAGKSTVLALLMRFYEPERGCVRLHGADARTIPLETYRSRIALVEQDAPVLFGTLRENLLYADVRADEDALWRAVRAARLTEFVADLPHGLDTVLGEHGTTLSGGQRQRIAIARALVADPAVLLLDEPTSALDSTTEATFLAALRSIAAQRAVLLIAHRMSTVRAADRVVVLEGGRVVDEGRHEQLRARNGYYRSMSGSDTAALAQRPE